MAGPRFRASVTRKRTAPATGMSSVSPSWRRVAPPPARSDAITAPLRTGADPEAVLTAFAASLLQKICGGDMKTSMRGVALVAPHAPDLAAAIYDAGPAESLRRLSAWLAEKDRKGLLRVPDPDLAAEMFSGMVLGHGHLRGILGVEQPDAAGIPERAAETARRFMRAFAKD